MNGLDLKSVTPNSNYGQLKEEPQKIDTQHTVAHTYVMYLWWTL